MTEPDYDYIIAGAGCAGLSLLVHLIRGQLPAARILLVDQAPRVVNDRTWCFWEKEPGPFEDIVFRKWSRLAVFGGGRVLERTIDPYRYKMIRGIDFYSYCYEMIGRQANVTVMQGRVERMYSAGGETYIIADGRKISCAYIFNSIPDEEVVRLPRHHYLLQHFSGWTIETPSACFDPGVATLMDFRVVRPSVGMAFAYVMPLSATRALVEYTLFSGALEETTFYEDGLKDHIERVLGIGTYAIIETEAGVIPMTDHPMPLRRNDIFYIGTAGGRTKASTGYTFQFIQRQSRGIVQALAAGKKPVVPLPSRRRRYYDSVLLNVLATGKLDGETVFSRLFGGNAIPDIFSFLDNESTLPQDLGIIFSLPTGPFLRAGLEELL